MSLSEFLLNKSYFKVKMHPIASNHFKIISKVNGVKGLFILDTGASTTFVDLKLEDKFKLTSHPSVVKASGAGRDKIDTLISKNNTLSIGGWIKTRFPIALIDLSYVNDAFESINTSPIDGIIGADILKKGFAVIDYEKRYLYLKHS
tara:strand:- start:16278 stop:16718 length:441 start_codon:yes stop_codon:yes gene_type:complete